MARPKKCAAPDLAERVSLTAGVIERLTCPTGKQQAFMRDTEAPGLRVRVTSTGAKSLVFEAKLNRQTIRRTIGDIRAWSIEQARAEARRLAALPRSGEWVFGPTAPKIAHNAAYNHRRALATASLPHVSLHGLRRSFGTLAEWVECPAGVVAQIQGHKPSATAEKHYRARPIDLPRMWHKKTSHGFWNRPASSSWLT